MHQIDSLEIAGFKSFRNNIRLKFTDNINAIVGPNGCGKSNICDAFMWVMGEQSARILRGTRMEDVIFNGTQRYGPVGFAEVILRLKYSASPEEDPMPREDVDICRRLYRDGTSEYYLNGKRCRLLDIQETFEGTGLGFTSYAIIEQGRIHNLISSKPSEKRALLEEAARIVSFKMRKKNALVKLEMARQNLVRIRDLVTEIERSLKSLKVQVQRAKRYRHLRDRMRAYLKVRFCLLADNYQRQLDDIAARLDTREQKAAELEGECRRRSASLNLEKEKLAARENRWQELQTEFNSLALNLQRITTSQGYLLKEQETLVERRRGIEAEIAQLTGREQENDQRLVSLDSLLAGAEKQLDEARQHSEESGEQQQQQNLRMASREKELEELRRAVFEDAGLLSSWRNQEAKLMEQGRWMEKQRNKLEGELATFRETHARVEKEFRDGEEILETVLRQLEERDADHAGLAESIEMAKGRRQVQSQKLDLLEKGLAASSHRLKSLEELEARNAFYSETVKRLLPKLTGEPAFHGTLADYLEVRPDADAVMENFLRTELESIVTDSPELLAKAISIALQDRTGVCQFLIQRPEGEPSIPRDDLPPACREDVLGRVIDLLQSNGEGHRLIQAASPDIGNVWLVRDWAAALRIARDAPGVACLSMDGVSVSRSGRVIVHGVSAGKGLLGYRREKRDLTGSIQRQQADVDRAGAILAEIREELERYEIRQSEVKDALDELRLRKVRQQGEIKRKSDEVNRFAGLRVAAETELANLLLEEEQVRTELARIQAQIAGMETKRQDRESDFSRCQEEIGGLKAELARLNRQYAEAQSGFAAVREKVNAQRAELSHLRRSREENRQRRLGLEEENGKNTDRTVQIQTELATFGERQQEALNRQEKLQILLTEHKTAVEESRQLIQELEQSLEEKRTALDEIRQARNQVEIEKAKVESELAHLKEAAELEFHHDPARLAAEIDPALAGLDAEEAQRQYLEYRDRVEKMGSVNLVAMEEYDREEERLRFHLEQEKDITESIVATEKAIEEIDQRSLKMFRETFAAVNGYFREMFTYLFGGGYCELKLVDDENLLESGVDIVASPPGKKLQNILLLSGGEKALTSLALLLAIFKYRPSPFCILDEVDAPLDESNIDRFCSLVKKMSAQTQYILITHNKRTMEIADAIYGVTMEEAGISKILSVQLKEVGKVLQLG